MVIEPPIRDGARLNDRGARPDEGARIGGSCASQASATRDSAVEESSCKPVDAAAMVPARAVATASANQQLYDAMLFHRNLQTCLLA